MRTGLVTPIRRASRDTMATNRSSATAALRRRARTSAAPASRRSANSSTPNDHAGKIHGSSAAGRRAIGSVGSDGATIVATSALGVRDTIAVADDDGTGRLTARYRETVVATGNASSATSPAAQSV
jgi:hypothetical protein